MRARASSSLVFAGALCAACSSDEIVDTAIQHPTLVEVAPQAFLGTLPCSDAPGGVQRYVATLTDVTPAQDAGSERGFVLPSSGPLPCTQGVGFSFVVPGRKYTASIDAYDRSDIAPLAPGLREMVDAGGEVRVAPRWTASCDTPVTAVGSRTQTVRGCSLLVDTAPSGETSVRVDLVPALGTLACGSEPGQVTRYTAELGYVSSALGVSSMSGRCDEQLTWTDLDPNQPVEVAVSAFEGEALEPGWGTSCTATTAPFVTVNAACSPLTTLGAVEIDVPSLLAELGRSCSAGLEVRASVPSPVAQELEILPPGCERPLRIAEIDVAKLAAGRQIVVGVEVIGVDGQCVGAADCAARVLPGRTVETTCTVDESCGPDSG